MKLKLKSKTNLNPVGNAPAGKGLKVTKGKPNVRLEAMALLKQKVAQVERSQSSGKFTFINMEKDLVEGNFIMFPTTNAKLGQKSIKKRDGSIVPGQILHVDPVILFDKDFNVLKYQETFTSHKTGNTHLSELTAYGMLKKALEKKPPEHNIMIITAFERADNGLVRLTCVTESHTSALGDVFIAAKKECLAEKAQKEKEWKEQSQLGQQADDQFSSVSEEDIPF